MTQSRPKMTRTFSAIFLTEKAIPQTFSHLECMVYQGTQAYVPAYPGICTRAQTSIHSKSEKVCGTAYSVKKNCGISAGHCWAILGSFWVILGPCCAFWAIFGSYLGHFGPFWVIFGHFWAISWHFWTNLRKVQIFLRDRWGQDPRF